MRSSIFKLLALGVISSGALVACGDQSDVASDSSLAGVQFQDPHQHGRGGDDDHNHGRPGDWNRPGPGRPGPGRPGPGGPGPGRPFPPPPPLPPLPPPPAFDARASYDVSWTYNGGLGRAIVNTTTYRDRRDEHMDVHFDYGSIQCQGHADYDRRAGAFVGSMSCTQIGAQNLRIVVYPRSIDFGFTFKNQWFSAKGPQIPGRHR